MSGQPMSTVTPPELEAGEHSSRGDPRIRRITFFCSKRLIWFGQNNLGVNE